MLITIAPLVGLQESDNLPYDEWMSKVSTFGDRGEENPANSQLDFFRNDFVHMASGNVILDTSLARRCSSTLQKAFGVSQADMERCIDYWKKSKFLK